MEEAVIGVDPGAKGAYCILVPGTNQIYFVDANLPPLTIHELLQYYRDHFSIQHIRLEDVHSIYGMSAKSNFSFGGAFWYVQAVFETLNYSCRKVQPKEWQAKIGVPRKVKGEDRDLKQIVKALNEKR